MPVSPESVKIGVLGTGDVGRTLAEGFASRGFAVKLGTRDPTSAKITTLISEVGHGVTAGTFHEAAQFGDILILAVGGDVVHTVLESAGIGSFSGKVVLDAVNPLTYGEGGLSLSMGFSTSMGETIQGLIPDAKVVKCLNTIGYGYMIDPRPINGVRPDMFIAGNDEEAKAAVTQLIGFIGWDSVVDMGNIEESRLLEPLALVWIKMAFKRHSREHFIKVMC